MYQRHRAMYLGIAYLLEKYVTQYGMHHSTQKRETNIKAMEKLFLQERIPRPGTFNTHTDSMEPTTKSKQLARLKIQARRITAVHEMKACLLSRRDNTPPNGIVK